ncbi:uncharacterized protein EDB93DRAFT_910012 [Suillus bovinus]|uniref:uncharacterized protein n=1 Tax=Suillus bovinus TaxID=48563 RepID=UPI001B864C05|nr:uncharacterized protein EDB93DRAFT_910012 [Suillus bovinus]KAG2132298.1 hypothetical protein EDB93DRAFT_910012 [Suillus bovinus]
MLLIGLPQTQAAQTQHLRIIGESSTRTRKRSIKINLRSCEQQELACAVASPSTITGAGQQGRKGSGLDDIGATLDRAQAVLFRMAIVVTTIIIIFALLSLYGYDYASRFCITIVPTSLSCPCLHIIVPVYVIQARLIFCDIHM